MSIPSNEEKAKYAGLYQENGFGPAYVVSLQRRLVRGRKAVHLLGKSVINMIYVLFPVF